MIWLVLSGDYGVYDRIKNTRSISQIYAERDLDAAKRVALKFG